MSYNISLGIESQEKSKDESFSGSYCQITSCKIVLLNFKINNDL